MPYDAPAEALTTAIDLASLDPGNAAERAPEARPDAQGPEPATESQEAAQETLTSAEPVPGESELQPAIRPLVIGRQVPRHGRQHADPTPEEIEAACLEIQREWTPAERRRRWTYKSPEWLPPGAERHPSPADSAARERGFKTAGRIGRAVQWDAGDFDEEPEEEELVHVD